MSENEKDNSTFRNYSKFKLIRFPLLSTPDGQDSLYKVFRTTLSTTTIGAVFTYLDLISTINLTTLNWKIIKGRFKKITIPAAFLGYVYSSTANVSGSIRGRNDSINHSNAGIASGIALAYLTNSLRNGILGCVIFSTIGYACKESTVQGYPLNVIKNFKYETLRMQEPPVEFDLYK